MASDDLTPAELERLQEWHIKIFGELPSYVTFWAKHNPRLLKATHHRWSKAFGNVLPAKFAATFEIQTAAITSDEAGLRFGVRLAKGFGITQEQVVSIVECAAIHGGYTALDKLSRVLDGEFGKW
jgi:hypothetical protein